MIVARSLVTARGVGSGIRPRAILLSRAYVVGRYQGTLFKVGPHAFRCVVLAVRRPNC
ncbi:MAG: hypothetical protein QOH42_1115 [Blastocatellia bacterium]|nr:hypothetical protein [Blastocatellia bacterium]